MSPCAGTVGSCVFLTVVSASGWCRSCALVQVCSSAAHDLLKASLLIHNVLLCFTIYNYLILVWMKHYFPFTVCEKICYLFCFCECSGVSSGLTKCAGDCLPSLLAPHDGFSSSCFIEEEESLSVSQHGLWGMERQSWDFHSNQQYAQTGLLMPHSFVSSLAFLCKLFHLVNVSAGTVEFNQCFDSQTQLELSHWMEKWV